ncbi:MAG: hypothetical protein IT480_06430 [Gammaproteobacteria bacterium]|nr:hypothetical protein [Gammaproteobacteria bacterium]
MSANLFYDPRPRPLSLAGEIMPGCYYQFYATGTTTPANVYADDALTTPLTNPVVADADGRFVPIYMDSSTVYRVQLYDADDVLQYDVDPVHPHATVPAGTVALFHGTSTERDAAYPPALWALCDGTSGTPDSRDRAPVGVSGTKPISGAGSSGGTAGTIQTGNAGAHTHAITVDAHVLTTAEMPAHNHRFYYTTAGRSASGDDPGMYSPSSGSFRSNVVDRSGVQLATKIIEDTGGGTAHSHTGSSASNGDHYHTISSQSPYFTLWFLKRKA